MKRDFWLRTGALRGNPKGIGSFSPGLRGTSYPGTARARSFFPTLKGLHQSHAVSPTRIKSINPVSSLEFEAMRFDATLSELMSCSGRVSQGSSFLATLG